MKLIFRISIPFLIAFFSTLVAYNSSMKKKMSHIVTEIWYNFEGDEAEFQFEMSSFGVKDKSGVRRYPHVPNGLGDSKNTSEESLGISASFERKGYNWIDIFPDPGKAKGKFPGQVKSVDMWVWGGNFLYRLEIILQDFRGYIYALPMGDLQYFGWRNKNISIPGSIPQDEPYAPRTKGLRFKKFRIYSTPGERVDRFHCFFDYFKIVTDSYKEQYDGWELEKVIQNEVENDNQQADGANSGATTAPAGDGGAAAP
jgi:hypothetical protein